ncbi:MAG: RNA-binding protein [Candidatus Dojkabacteria bacterium]|uniref:RNA-binding protein n=1 Tax=Candidatus Dojkabacteria bacterium TaxID=2099670 RepID=A0A952AHU7_9BACT|nr:RNA-binding protein [Candidatus Dojkabacteria bacterium]WKZ27705.1 MAG: RNA-binding protein [Candidatus Dojkabacteria bacterium]
MENRMISVANLSWGSSESEIQNLFEQAGNVKEVKLVRTNDGLSLGEAIVTMATEAATKKAIDTLHGTSLKGKKLKLSVINRQDNHYSKMLITMM